MELLVIFAAKYLIWLVALAVLAYCFALPARHRLTFALMALGALPLAWLIARFFGLLFSHPQPFAVEGTEPLIPHAVDNSFPSDHTALGFALASSVAFANRWLGLLLAIAALLVGLARVAAALHYPVDIAAGALAGAAAAALSRYAISYFVQRQG